MFIGNARPGQNPFRVQKMRVVNRCGSTALALGDVVALDVDASDTDTQSKNGVGGETLATLTEAMFANVVQPGAAPKNALVGVVSNLLSGAGADNTEVEITIEGPCKAKVGGTDWSTARSSCGVALQVDTTSANRRLKVPVAGPNVGKVAIILEDIAVSLASTNKVVDVLLFGFGASVGDVGATAA